MSGMLFKEGIDGGNQREFADQSWKCASLNITASSLTEYISSSEVSFVVMDGF
jgi:hypothetical protein